VERISKVVVDPSVEGWRDITDGEVEEYLDEIHSNASRDESDGEAEVTNYKFLDPMVPGLGVGPVGFIRMHLKSISEK